MKLRTMFASSLLVTTAFSANAYNFLDTLKEAFGMGEQQPTEQAEAVAKESVDTSTLEAAVNSTKESSTTTSNALVDYASEQLGLSKEITSGALGAVLKVAKDNLGDNFTAISEAIPNVESYIDSAPSEVKSSLGGLASSLGNDKAQALASLGYLDSAFETLGIPKETVLPLVDTLSNYLENNNYGSAAEMLKKGVSFL